MSSGSASQHVVLVVEDEAILRMVAHDTLIDAGYAVIEAANAAEALELLNVRSDITAMITDVNMGGEMSGFALSLVVSGKSPEIAILVVSGAETPKEGDMPPGARFVAKPYAPSALLDFMENVVFSKSG